MAAVFQNVLSVPVVPYLFYFTDDKQLSYVERYLVRVQSDNDAAT